MLPATLTGGLENLMEVMADWKIAFTRENINHLLVGMTFYVLWTITIIMGRFMLFAFKLIECVQIFYVNITL